MQVFELLAEQESGAEMRIRNGSHNMVRDFEDVMKRPDVDVAMLSAYFMRLPQQYTDFAGDVEQEEKFTNALKGWANKKFLNGSDTDVDNVNLTQLSTAIMDWISKNPASSTTPAAAPAAANNRDAQARAALATLGQ